MFRKEYKVYFCQLAQFNGVGDFFSFSKILSFSLHMDLYAKEICSLTVANLDENIRIGDVAFIGDNEGQMIYSGIIESIKGNELELCELLRLIDQEILLSSSFDGDASGLGDYFERSMNMHAKRIGDSRRLPNLIEEKITVGKRIKLKPSVDQETFNPYQYCKEIAKQNIKLSISFYFLQNKNRLKITTAPIGRNDPIKIADNTSYIVNFIVDNSSTQTNRLSVWRKGEEGEMPIFVESVFLTANGRTENSADLTRPLVIRGKNIFVEKGATREEINEQVEQHLDNQLYSHQIEITMRENDVYAYENYSLGSRFELLVNGKIYKTILTGKIIEKKDYNDSLTIKLIFGKERTRLTDWVSSYGR